MIRPLRTILLVEDDPDIQTVVGLALREIEGAVVTTCSSGSEALERAQTIRPDLILLDVMMPKMDGPATLQALRLLPGLESTPVVFLTARVQAHEIARYEALGAVGVLPKPFDPLTLGESVVRLWRGCHA